MKTYLIATQIEVEEDQLPTLQSIRDKIETDLNRGDGIYMETSSKVMTIRSLNEKSKPNEHRK